MQCKKCRKSPNMLVKMMYIPGQKLGDLDLIPSVVRKCIQMQLPMLARESSATITYSLNCRSLRWLYYLERFLLKFIKLKKTEEETQFKHKVQFIYSIKSETTNVQKNIVETQYFKNNELYVWKKKYIPLAGVIAGIRMEQSFQI